MTDLRSVADYEREIAHLDWLINAAERVGDAASGVVVSGLAARREELTRVRAAMGDAEAPGHEMEVVLTGKPVEGHTVHAGFLSAILDRLQKIVRSAVNNAAGTRARSGRFADAIARRGTLRFAGAFESSFGMRLETADDQMELGGTSPIAPTFDALVRLLSSSTVDDMVDPLATLGQRATGHVRELLEDLRKGGADMRVRWPSSTGILSAHMTATRAAQISEQFEQVESRQVGRTIVGEMDGGLRKRGLFGFQADSGEMYEGTISPDILEDRRDFMFERCKAWIVTNTVRNRLTGKTSEKHRLLELSPLDAPDFSDEVPDED